MTPIPAEAVPVLDALQVGTDLQLAVEPEVNNELWYRDNDSRQQWIHLNSYRQAEDLIRARTPVSPWVTIARFVDTGNDDDYRTYGFEVLGWGGEVYVCGDTSGMGWQWRWSSWPIGAATGKLTVTVIGPSWYRAGVWKEQLLTVNDAVAQLWPATHAEREVQNQAPGYDWLPRDRDCVPNRHLRVPDD